MVGVADVSYSNQAAVYGGAEPEPGEAITKEALVSIRSIFSRRSIGQDSLARSFSSPSGVRALDTKPAAVSQEEVTRTA